MSAAAGLASALRDFRYPRLWLGVWLFGWALCIALSLLHPPEFDIDVADSDKIGHFLAYATLSAWAVLIFARGRAHWLAALALVLLGIGMELAQGAFTSDRLMDARDAIANTLGVLFGQAIAATKLRVLLQRIDGVASP